ncbi:MAG: winged helix-turn-helix transcriptional regulator [Flavobacteriales bacterium]|nr:winged helix-turn-helix transcriptional regulator [Flavobacteriales bacterium]
MGLTKSNLFTEEQNQLAAIAKAVAHPARIAIIQHIIKSKTCINNELVKELGLAQATVSQHLKALKEVGIIQGTIEGASICYCIDSVIWDKMKNELAAFFEQSVSCSSENCC